MSTPVTIITGASQGIGAGLVAGYRRAGYAVVGVARSHPTSDDESEYVAVGGDIAEAETARRAVDQALDRFGRIDTLINNAGVYIGKPFLQYTVEDYATITAVNLTGFFHITQLAIEQMVEQGSGHVINISTSLVDRVDSKRPSALPALTKGGLVAASRSLAIEYASRGVRVNAVSLGVIQTPAHDPASYTDLQSLHPLGRVGEISDVVDAILTAAGDPWLRVRARWARCRGGRIVERLLDGVEPLSLGVERSAAVVVDQPQVARAVRDFGCAPLHHFQALIGPLESVSQAGEAGADRGVVGEVGGQQLHDALVLDARHRRRQREPFRERATTGVRELVVSPRARLAGLGAGLQQTELRKALWLSVVVALRGRPEDRALAHHPHDVVRAGAAATDEREDHVGERRQLLS
jgi:NAD(P)-dependent dehydrogenase (short-subunit alcohol dehydrogenase family)